MLAYSVFCIADEVVAGFEKDEDLPVLNEVLRKQRTDVDDVIYQASTNTTEIIRNQNNIATVATIVTVVNKEGIKGWCSFDGTGANGTKTPKSSYNVTSVWQNQAGEYVITWDTDFADANYAVNVSAGNNGDAVGGYLHTVAATSVRIETRQNGGGLLGTANVCVMAIEDQS